MRARRTDANHAEIMRTFRRLGWSVADTSRLGGGFPDLVVAKAGRTVLVEVKDGEKPPSARKLTTAEREFRATWQGEYRVVASVDDVRAISGSVADDVSGRMCMTE